MTTKIVPVATRLTGTRATLYTCPADCISATVLGGTVTHLDSTQPVARLFLKKGPVELWFVNSGKVPFVGSPWRVPILSLAPGQTLDGWADINGVLDINLTIGEQR